VLGGCCCSEDVVVAEFEHRLVPGNHQFSFGVFGLNYFEDLAHCGGLLGIDSFVIVGGGLESLGAGRAA